MFKRKQLGKTDIYLAPFSIGCSTFGNMYGDMDETIMKELVENSIDYGLNYFDTSPYYGNQLSEINLGKALSGINREDFIISTKLGRYGDDLFDFSEKTLMASIDDSLKRLNLEYVDVLLLHDIEYADFNQIITEALPALQKIKDSGKARYIGFSCYPIELIQKTIEHSEIEIDVVLSYAHYCLINHKLDNIIPFLKEKEIGIINASALCMGLLSTNPLPEWHPAPYEMIDYLQEKAVLLNLKYDVKIEDYALAYVLFNDDIDTTLVGIKTLSELENLIYVLKNTDTFSHDIYEYIINYMERYVNIELAE